MKGKRLRFSVNKISYKTLLIVVVFLLIAILLLWRYVLPKNKAEAAWWNDGWRYRKAISVSNNSGSTLTEFQIPVSIGTSALIADGKMKNDCGDIRFVDANGSLISYWIEESGPNSCNSLYDTKIWLKIASVPVSGTSLYFYYGNSRAESVSSGENTFIFFKNNFQTHEIDWNWSNGGVENNMMKTWASGYDVPGSTMAWLKKIIDISGQEVSVEFTVKLTKISSTSHNTTNVIFNPTDIDYLYTNTGSSNIINSGGNSLINFGDYPTWYGKVGFDLSYGQGNNIANNTLYPLYAFNTDGWVRHVHTLTNSSLILNGYSLGGLDTLGNPWAYADKTITTGYTKPNTIAIAIGEHTYDPTYLREVFIRKYISNIPTYSVQTEELGGGPIAYWKFDEGVGTTAYDYTSNQNNGIISGATWTSEDQCISGKCLIFDGVDDSVNANFNYPSTWSDPFSISTWIYVPSSAIWSNGYYGNIISRGSYGGSHGLARGSSDNEIRMWVRSDNGAISVAGTITRDKWYYVAGTWNGTELELFINGQSKEKNGSARTGTPDATSWTIATAIAFSGAGGNWFTGLIDEPKIYPYARTADQIKQDYNSRGSASLKGSGVNMGSNKNNNSLFDGLVGYWKMDENIGSSMVDHSGNNNTASLSNISWTAGKYGVGVSFNGVTSFISTTKNFSSTSPYSIVLWAKPGTIMDTGRRNIIVGPGPVWNPGLWVANNIIRVHAATEYRDYAISWNDLSWHMVGQIFDGTTVWTIWDDQIVLGTRTAYSPTTPTLLYLGAQNTTGTAYNWHGLMDEVRYYNRALSPNEVVQLYNYSPGLVGYWNFDEGEGLVVKDLSGNNNGALQGTTSWKQGKFGSALETNSSATANRMYASTNNMPINSALTLESWVYPTSYGSEEMTVINGDNAYYLSVYKTGEINCYWYGTSNPGYHGSGAGTVPLNTWTHITCAWDGSSLRIYTNGILKNTVSTSGAGSKANHIVVGAESTSRQFKGLIDEARIYNYARSQKQIIEDMNAGIPSTSIKSIMAYYKFDEGQGLTVNNWGNGGIGLSGIFGSDSSSPMWTNEGKSQKAVSFNGNNEINTSSFSGLSKTTWSFWVKPRTTISQLMFRNLGASDYIAINTDGKAFRFRTFSGSGDILTNSGILPINQWSHIAMTYSNPGIKLYLNGKLENQKSTYTLGNLNSNFRIGRYDSSYNGLNGLIDEVKIYNYVLTDEEIKQDYNQGSAFSFGSSTQTIGNTTTSLEYCVPGDTSYCVSPVAEWKMDEGSGNIASDASGNNLNGTVSGATWTQGKIGQSLFFSGSSPYVMVSDHSLLKPTNAITTEAWFNTSDKTANQRILSKTEGSGYSLSLNENAACPVSTLCFTINLNGTYRSASYPVSNISNNTWYHVVGSYDGSTVRLFLNGISVGTTTTVTNTILQAAYNLCIGAECAGLSCSGGSFKGKIDYVKIYDYARTSAQIAYDYNKGGPVAWWKLDECQGNTAYDWSGNQNNGNISIGASGSQNALGTCSIGTSTAWFNGSEGKLNSSLSFDGIDDYFSVSQPSIITSPNLFTISFFIKPENQSGYIISPLSCGYDQRILYDLSNSRIGVGIAEASDLNERSRYSRNNSVLNNKWSHVVVSINDKNIKIYINGILDSEYNETINICGWTNTWYIAQRGISTTWFKGKLDDIRVYNYELSSEQIKILYNNGAISFN